MSAEPNSRGPDEGTGAGEVEEDEENVEAVGVANAEVFIAETTSAQLTSRETGHTQADFDFNFDENYENFFYYYLDGEVLNVDPVRAGPTSITVDPR